MAADQQIEGLFSQGTFSSSPASRNSWSTGVLHRILAWLPEWGVSMNRIVPIVAAETGYHTKHPGYTCSLSELATLSSEGSGEHPKMPIDPDLAKGTKQGYVFALTGCDPLHYKIAAEPATPSAGHRAFCSGQNFGEDSGEVSAGFSVD